jgi:phage terminase large subunit
MRSFALNRAEGRYAFIFPQRNQAKLADRRGWATFIWTPKGKNEFFRLYQEAQKDPNWFHMILKASESGIISAAELTDLQREMGEDQYQQEFECSFEAAIKGAFYAEEMRATR